MTETTLREFFERLRSVVPETRAIVLVDENGEMLENLTVDASLDLEGLVAEFATLLRIAQRTSEDTGSGDLQEHIMISSGSMTIARNLASDHFLILLSGAHDQIGRARYELKLAARELERVLR